MIVFFLMILLIGIVLIGIGVYQKKTYFDKPHFQEVQIIGYENYQNNAHGTAGLAVDMISSTIGMKHPVVDVTLEDSSLKSVRMNIAVNDQVITQRPELDIGGRVNVQFFGDDPKIVYLTNHPMAQTVVKTSAFMIVGIALTALGILLVGADIYYTLTI